MVRRMTVEICFECDCEPADPSREATDPIPSEEQVCDTVEKAIREQVATPAGQQAEVMEAVNTAIVEVWARACEILPSHVSVGGSAWLELATIDDLARESELVMRSFE